MPKYQYRRPYYPYVRGGQYQNNPYSGVSGAMEQGTKMGEMVAKAIAANKQNQIANQLAAQYGLYAPRAQWVGGTPPPTGVDTKGTSLADQGGVEGLKLRMAMQQQQNTQRAAQTKAQLQQALIDQARGKARSVWTGKTATAPGTTTAPSGKTATYKPGAYDYENGTLNGVKTPDSMQMLQTDVNGVSGYKNMAAGLLAAIPSMKVVNGKLTIPPTMVKNAQDQNVDVSKYRFNSDGSFSILDANGNAAGTLQSGDVQTALNRLNAMKIRNGETPLPNPYLKGTESTSTFQPGTKENPYQLDPNKPNTTFRALPFNSYFQDPKNNIQLKQAPGQTQQNTVQQPNTPANQFPTPSEGGTSTDLLKATRPDTGGVNIPLRPSETPSVNAPYRSTSTDQSSADSAIAQNQPNTPVPPNAPVDSSGGGTIARIDPNSFAPPTQQDRNQIADAVLPNRDVVPVVSNDDRDLLNRSVAAQLLLNQDAQT